MHISDYHIRTDGLQLVKFENATKNEKFVRNNSNLLYTPDFRLFFYLIRKMLSKAIAGDDNLYSIMHVGNDMKALPGKIQLL